MKQKTHRLLSLLLCIVLVLGLMPTTVFAATYIEDGITVIHGNITFELSGYEIGKSATDITLTSKQEGIILQQPTIYVGGSTTPYTGLFEPDVQYVLVLEEPTTESGYKILKGSTYYHISMTVNGEKETIEEFLNTETIRKFEMPKLYTDYGITVNGLKVTSQNKDDIYARKDGKTITNNPGTVTYDPDTKTLRIKSVLRDPDTDENQTIIFGNGEVNIVIEPINDTYKNYVSGKLTIRDANNVSVYSKGTKAILGNADIRKVNDVKIICDDGILTYGNLAIVGANDVFLSAKNDGVNAPVLGQSGFQCNTLTVENKGNYSKFCTDLFTFKKPDGVTKKYIYEEKDKETGIYEVKEVLTDYILEFIGTYFGKPTGGSYRIRPEAESETINRIYFDSNGGTGKMESIICMSDTYTLPENKFTPPEGKEFKGWSTSSTGDVFSGTSISMSDVPGSIELYAIWQDKSDVDKYDITVTDGKATIGAGTEISKAAEGTTVTLTANAAPSGKVFDKWVVESGDITLADASSATTTFTMPAGAVSVKATYKDKPVTTYNLTTQVNGGHGTISAGKTGLTSGSTETVIFTPDTGYEIDTVTVNGVETGVLSNVLNVTMDADKTVIVTYKEITHTHTPSDWKSDADNHWKECTVVGCGVIIEGSKAAHTASDWITDTAATATTDGTKYKECTDCKRVLETGTIPATGSGEHTHSYGSDWKSDADKHWHECSCGAKSEEAAHSFKWVVDKEATATEKGSKHEECEVCGYKKSAVEIPATGTPTNPTNPGDPDSPQTGDNSNMMLWFAVLFVSGFGVLGTVIYGKKRKEKAE